MMNVAPGGADGWHGGRTAVVAAGLVGAALFAQQLVSTDVAFYTATIKALVGGLVVLGIASLGKQVWAGANVDRIGAAGASVGLSGRAAEATEHAVESLNGRLTAQMEDVNKRLYDLETFVFKRPVGHNGDEE